MTQLRKVKNAIRMFVRQHWSDEKLCAVYAFNRDGRMDYYDSCACLIGVTEAHVLHNKVNKTCPERPSIRGIRHYVQTIDGMAGARNAENAYVLLGLIGITNDTCLIKTARQNRLSAILRAEMRRRGKLLAAEQAAGDREIALLKAAAGPGVVNVTDQDLDALAEVLRG